MRDVDRRVRAARGRAAWATVTGACALAAACAHRPPPPSRIIHFESRVAEGRLDNGLRALVAEDHATNLVAVGIRVEAGSTSDPPGKAGLAHLVEHLLFQVQPGGRPVASRLTAISVEINAETSWDATQYYEVARADQLDEVLALEAARMSAPCSSIPEGSFEREREVVRNELRLDNVFGAQPILHANQLLAALYPAGHPYHRATGGDDLQVSNLTRQDVCDFMAAHYKPDRMSVVVTGDVQAGATLGDVAARLAVLSGHATAPPVRFPSLAGARKLSVRWPVAHRYAMIAWPLPAQGAPGHAAAQVAFRMLAGERQVPGEGHIIGGPRAPLGVLVMSADKHEDLDRALVRVWKGIDGLTTRPDDFRQRRRLEKLFQHQINRAARDLLDGYDSLTARVVGLAGALQFEGERHHFVRGLVALDQLTAEGEIDVARTVLARTRATVLLVEPDGSMPKGPPRSQRSYAGKSHDDDWEVPVHPADAFRPLTVPIPRSSLVQARRYRLSSGLRLIVLPEAADPLMRARLVFAGGRADDPIGREGQADLAAALLHPSYAWSGTDETGVNEALYRFGDDLDEDVGLEFTVLSADGLSAHMDALLAGLASEIEHPDYGTQVIEGVQKELDKDRKQMPRPIRALERQVRRFDEALVIAMYGGGHPYSRVDPERPAANMSASDLLSFARRHYAGLNGVLIVTGQVNPEQVREQADYYFDELSPGAPYDLVRPPAAPPGGRRVVTVATDPAQPVTQIVVAFPVARSRPLRAARLLIARMLRHRVRRVREVLGASYVTDASYVDNSRGPGMLVITAPVDQARAGEALVAILAQVKAMRDSPGDMAEDFVRARREVLARALAQESGTEETASRLVGLVEHGDPLDQPSRLAHQVARLTLDQVSKQAVHDLDPRGEFVGLLGPAASIAAARTRAGL